MIWFKIRLFFYIFIILGIFSFSYLLWNLNKYYFFGSISKKILELQEGDKNLRIIEIKNSDELDWKNFLKIKIPKKLYIIDHIKNDEELADDFVFMNTIYYSKDNLDFFSLLNPTIRHEIIHYYIWTNLKYYIDRQKNNFLYLFYKKIWQSYFKKIYNNLNCQNFYKQIDNISDYNLLLYYTIFLKKCLNFDKIDFRNYKKYWIKDYFFKIEIYTNYKIVKEYYKNQEITEELITYLNEFFINNDYKKNILKKLNCSKLEDKIDRKICKRMVKFYNQIFVLK